MKSKDIVFHMYVFIKGPVRYSEKGEGLTSPRTKDENRIDQFYYR